MADKKDHYTAVIEIHRVTEAHSIEGTSNYNREAKLEVPRETKEVTRLFVSGVDEEVWHPLSFSGPSDMLFC